MTSKLVVIALLGGCQWGGGPGQGATGKVIDAGKPDAAPKKDAAVFKDAAAIDSAILPDAAIDAPAVATAHLLLTELCTTPDGSEFIEVYNPTTAAIDLTHY